ncbi:tripartite tricarboxylate transporter substrate binding protein [Bordetella tumulicola]|uniref:tripartite tricarboxylate transporter substrate binding protein n=1 Tax=Bordetella tumulicola TaxID=1649133 RepID=UPI0039F080F2
MFLKYFSSVLFFAVILIQPAWAQDYPARPLRMVVPIGPGSSGDAIFRALAERMSAALGQPVIVESKPGADALVATQSVLNAPADGYTLGFSSLTTVNAPATNKAAKYDPLKDFRSIAIISQGPLLLAVGPKSRFNTISEVVQASREKPESVTLGLYSSTYRLGALMMGQSGGIKFRLIPYKAFPQLINDVIGETTDVGLVDVGAALPMVRDGKIRALATTTAKPLPALPNVPTVGESINSDYHFTIWVGVVVRSQTPEPIVDKLEKVIRTILVSEDFRSFAAKNNPTSQLIALTGEKAVKFYESEAQRYKEILPLLEYK